MNTTAIVCLFVLAMALIGSPFAQEASTKTFDERFAEAAKTIGSGNVLLSDPAVKALDDLASATKADDIPFLTEKLKKKSLLAGLVLARLAREHNEAFDALVKAASAGIVPAKIAIGLMEPALVRQAGLALLNEKSALPENRSPGAYLLAIVGKKDDIPVLQKVVDEGEDSCRTYLEELQFKVEKMTADQEAQWEQAGLEYRFIGYVEGRRSGGRTLWMTVAQAANSKGRAQLPIEYLRFKIARRETFAVALAGFRKEPELVADLEKVASGSGRGSIGGIYSPSWLAIWSLEKIGTEEAVNAGLRASTTWENSDLQHFDIARYAAEKGGPSTLPILQKISENEQLTDEVRKYYKDAIEKLSKRLETPAAPPANGEPAPPPTNGSTPISYDTSQPSATTTSAATDSQSPAEHRAEAPVAEATPFPWAIVIIVAAAALALGAITTFLLTRRKKA